MNHPFFLFGLLIGTFSQAQPIGITFGGQYADQGIEIKKTSDGNLLMIGSTSSYSESNDIYLVKTDLAGVKIWEKNIDGGKEDFGWDMEEIDKDKSYLIVGFSNSFGKGVMDIILAKVNEGGQLLWIKNIPTPNEEDRGVSIEKTRDGNFIIIGQSKDPVTKNYDGLVVKIDGDGNLIWKKKYGGQSYDRLFYGKETTQGDILLTGISRKDSLSENMGWVLLISKEGVEKKSVYLQSIKNTTPHGMLVKSKNEFIVIGYAQTDTAQNQRTIYLSSFDRSCNMNWEKTVQEEIANTHGLSATITPSSEILVAGYTRPLKNGKWNGVLYKFSRRTDLLWRKEFGGEQADMPYTITYISKNKFALTGQTTSFGNGLADLWLVMFNDKGEILNN